MKKKVDSSRACALFLTRAFVLIKTHIEFFFDVSYFFQHVYCLGRQLLFIYFILFLVNLGATFMFLLTLHTHSLTHTHTHTHKTMLFFFFVYLWTGGFFFDVYDSFCFLLDILPLLSLSLSLMLQFLVDFSLLPHASCTHSPSQSFFFPFSSLPLSLCFCSFRFTSPLYPPSLLFEENKTQLKFYCYGQMFLEIKNIYIYIYLCLCK